jgi:hypothetical protein
MALKIDPAVDKSIQSQPHYSLANTATIAEKAVGVNAHASAVRM